MKSAHAKNALLAYIVEPFQIDSNAQRFRIHTNRWRNLAMAQCLNDAGYNVDVINWHDERTAKKVKQKYDLIIGLGDSFNYLVTKRHELFKKIVYLGTGTFWKFQNSQEEKRISEVNRKYKSNIPPERLVYQPENLYKYVDAIVLLGAKQGESTYRDVFKGPIHLFNNHGYDDFDFYNSEKDYEKAKNNFVYISGPGFVLNGLDLLLEIFSRHPEWNLNIYCRLETDTEFVKTFDKELFHTSNIHYQGVVDVGSNDMKSLVNNNVAVITAIASGASHGSVVVCMNHGLIPLVTEYANINGLNCGVEFKSLNVDVIEKEIESFANHTTDWFKKESAKTYKFARKYFSQKFFLKRFSDILKELRL